MNRQGQAYAQSEIDELYAEHSKPGAHARSNLERLAAKFGRTPTAISYVFSWCKKERGAAPRTFPPKAMNRIRRQVADAHQRLG